MTKDIIDDFLHRLAQAVPELPAGVPQDLERSMREAWGGEKPYVHIKPGRAARAARLAESMLQRKPLQQCFTEAGLSRRDGFRILASK